MYSFEIRILKVFYLENISFFELIDCIIILNLKECKISSLQTNSGKQ